MIEKPLFSVVIPVYNTEKELPRCIDSVLAQSCDDYEIILVDDGSTDRSGTICDEYSESDDRVISIHQKNAGCSEARNTGIRASRGEYLLFLDSDDMWDDNHALTGIQQVIHKENPDVICFGVSIYREDGSLEKQRIPNLPDKSRNSKRDIVEHLVKTNQYFSTSYVKALKRDFFLHNGLFFIKDLLSEDIEWSARILVLCKRLSVYPSAFYKRIRRSEGSITSSIGEKNIRDILRSIENGVAFAEEHSEDQNMLDLYYEYWAYQYAMLLGLAQKLHKTAEFSEVYSRLHSLKWLLKYDHEKKVRAVHFCSKALGLRTTMALMSMYYRM